MKSCDRCDVPDGTLDEVIVTLCLAARVTYLLSLTGQRGMWIGCYRVEVTIGLVIKVLLEKNQKIQVTNSYIISFLGHYSIKNMANTYTQIHIHAVFVVKYRRALIQETWEDRLYKYMTGIVQKHGHKMLQINGMPDHVHIFFGMRPVQSLSELMKVVKGDSSKWINTQGLTSTRFRWQPGYAAFSYAPRQVPTVIRYIKNQKLHHARKSFAKEFRAFLEEFEVKYDERYLPIFLPSGYG